MNSLYYDEFFNADGTPRPHCQLLFNELQNSSVEKLEGIQERVTRTFSTQSISFTLYGEDEQTERIIPIDCIPRILPADEWDRLEAGLIQRVTALNQFVVDVYSKAQILKDGVVPHDLVLGCTQYRIEMRGMPIPLSTPIGICGTDLVRINEGFRVLEDNLRVPSGVSYMIANRQTTKTNFRNLYRQYCVREVENYGEVLYETLREFAPHNQSDPCIALLTPGVFNSAFYEHMFLADEVGAELVEGRDLIVNDGYVYMRTTSGLRKVDVIYRRIDDDFLDPLCYREDSVLGVPGLMHVYRKGNVALVNAPGTGVADDKAIYAYVPKIIQYYLAEEPILQNVETHLCREPETLQYVLDNLKQLVVKPVGGSGGYGLFIGSRANSKELDAFRVTLQENAAQYIAQPELQLSKSPCWIDRRFQSRCVDLRPFILSGTNCRLVGGAFCRIALPEGSLVVNSSQGGGAKDLWVTDAAC